MRHADETEFSAAPAEAEARAFHVGNCEQPDRRQVAARSFEAAVVEYLDLADSGGPCELVLLVTDAATGAEQRFRIDLEDR